MVPFVHLHVHSQYSILDGQAKVSDLVDKAIENGMRGMALTDHGNMFGIKDLHDYCQKKNKGVNGQIKDLKKQLKDASAEDAERINAEIAELKTKIFMPIFGCEVYVAEKSLYEHVDKHDIGRHLILLAKNEKGYHNLVKIVSKAWTDGRYMHPRTDKQEIVAHREGLIVCSACLGGEIPRLIMQDRIDEAREATRWWKETFGDDYYIEIQRHKATVPKANHETFIKQQQVNKVLLEFAKELDIKVVATNDVHFTNEDDADAHERLICLNTGKKLDDPKRMLYSKQEWFKTQEEMNEVFADVPESLQNTNEILDKVEMYTIDHDPILPNFPIPEGFDGPDDYLRHLVYEGAKRLWPGDQLDEEHRERLDFELETIKTMGFPGYFLIVQDYINVAPSLGVSVGPGRGSAAGSAVAYCLGITKIDPIKYDLLFERFLNPDRISLPDIDVDFDDDGRAVILKYVTDKYGAEKVAHIITYGTMAAKMAVKDVARVEDLPLADSNRLAKIIPASPNDMPEGDNGKKLKITINNCIKAFPELRNEAEHGVPKVQETLKYAAKLEGTVRSTGVHACGVIIGRDDITDWVPVSTADDSNGEKLIVTQYEGSVIESTGLIKMDFLGLKTLSILMEAVKNIKETRGIDVDVETIPIDDPKTYQLYCEGRTKGTFQFESPGMQKYLRELHPSTFEDLIAMNALYRPGPMQYIPDFIDRKLGRKPIVYDIPIMEKYLKDTYGITVYQEQVMLLSRQLAGFTRGQSDTLRKAMGKKQIDKMNHLQGLFFEGGVKNGHDRKVLEKIWEDWKQFASYAFNKSHATCYSWVAYQTAYLKANYPSEYMAAVMSRNLNDLDKVTQMMEECKEMGIKIKSPNVNESRKNFSTNISGDIIFGLGAIKGVPTAAVEGVIAEREANGEYKDVYELVERVSPKILNKKALESFVLAGALDIFGIPRESYFEPCGNNDLPFYEELYRYGQNYQNDKANQINSLFGDILDTLISKPQPPKAEEWGILERLRKEKDLVGYYLSAHPLDPFFVQITYGCTASISKVKELQRNLGHEFVFGGIITDYREGTSKKGNPYAIFKIEDKTDSLEIPLFGDSFRNFRNFGIINQAIYVKALYKTNWRNEPTLEPLEMGELASLSSKIRNVRIDVKECQIENLSFLNSYTEAYDKEKIDNCDLYFRFFSSETQQSVTLRSNQQIKFGKEIVDLLNSEGFNFKVNAV